MSLVICSNQYQENERTSNNNQAYSFKNNLGTQMKIPPNSEVAVQSVKINKDGSITIKPTDIFYIYQGDLIPATLGNIDLSNSYPVRVQLNTSKITEEVDINTFASRIQSALNRGIINLAFNGLQTVTVKRDGSGVFQGFDFKITQQNACDTTNSIPTNASPYYKGFDSYYSYSAGVFTSLGLTTIEQNRRVGILTDSPLGNVKGKFKVTLTTATGTSWGIGLRRSRFNNTGQQPRRPEYFSRSGDVFGASNIFFDYVVMGVQDAKNGNRFLRVYQSCLKEDVDHGDQAMQEERPICMREVVYYGGHNASFASVYNMSTNSASYTFVEFELNGDQLNLSIGNGSGTAALVNKTTLTTSTKANLFKPMALTTQLLYPQLWLQKPTKILTVNTFNGKSGYTFGNPARDWWARMEQEGLTNRFCKRVDTRYWANLEDADIYGYKLPNGSGVFDEADYPPVLVLTEDITDYVNTIDANCETLLGFEGQPVIDNPDYTVPTYTFTSNSAPKLTSRGSAFVRLNNFTQQSFNAGKGALSKILYHLPRFDNSGNEVGSDLFYESAEKTYVALNNSNELNINTFDIDIVTEQEVYATDLVGKTIVVLHFRQKSHKM